MLHVTVENIDNCWQGVFETYDKRKAALFALEDLQASHGFFKDNVLVTDFPPSFTPGEDVFGMIMLADEASDPYEIEYAIQCENTYWVTVREFIPNKMQS